MVGNVVVFLILKELLEWFGRLICFIGVVLGGFLVVLFLFIMINEVYI